MKKVLSLVLAAIFALSTGVTAVGAAECEHGYVSVSTKAAQEFSPNVANVRFYVETSDKDLNIATQKNKEQTQSALEAIKKQLDTSKGDSVKTVNFSANPEYSYKNNKKTFVQYNVKNSFQVTIKNIDKLGTVIAEGLKNGATSVNDLNFALDNTDAACNVLIKEAVKLSKARADETARAAGSQVTGIKSINANCSGDSAYYPRFKAMNSAKYSSAEATDAVGSAIPTESGTIKMFANVNASYFVK